MPLHVQAVEQQQAALEDLPYLHQNFERLERLDAADDAEQGRDDAGLGAGFVGAGAVVIQTPVTWAVALAWKVHTDLPFKPNRGARN